MFTVLFSVYLTVVCAGFVQTESDTGDLTLHEVYNKLQDLEKKYSDVVEEVKDLRSQNLEKKYSDVVEEVKDLRSQNQKLQEKFLSKRQQYAFTAFNPYVQGKVYNAGEVVQFTDVYTNIGGAYNGETSKFTCSVTGTYLFGLSMFSVNGYFMEAVIMVGDVRTSGMHLNDSGWFFGGTVEVVDCTAGTEVWVTVVTNNNAMAEVWNENKVATFTGVLIEADL